MSTLPQTFADTNDLTTSTRGVVVLYGRKSDGTLVSVLVDNNGVLSSSAVVTAPGGSANYYFKDQAGTALTGVFVQQTFGFLSYNITLYNDDSTTEALEFSFDGANVHGRLKKGEMLSMNNRGQLSIYLRSVSGNPFSYRLMVY